MVTRISTRGEQLLTDLAAHIDALDTALRDQQEAKVALSLLEPVQGLIEAQTLLDAEGRTQDERKAHMTVTLAGDEKYRQITARIQDAQQRLADASRRAQVAREQCRRTRMALALLADTTHTTEEL